MEASHTVERLIGNPLALGHSLAPLRIAPDRATLAAAIEGGVRIIVMPFDVSPSHFLQMAAIVTGNHELALIAFLIRSLNAAGVLVGRRRY